MNGPEYYYGPPDPEIRGCPCGESEEDCLGECYAWSLTQLADPLTGERLGGDLVDSIDECFSYRWREVQDHVCDEWADVYARAAA